MSDAPAPELPVRQISPGTRKFFLVGLTIDLILAVGMFFMGLLSQATSPVGRGAWLETFIALAILVGAPGIGWSLYNTSRVDIRWIMLLVWSPLILLVGVIFYAINFG